MRRECLAITLGFVYALYSMNAIGEETPKGWVAPIAIVDALEARDLAKKRHTNFREEEVPKYTLPDRGGSSDSFDPGSEAVKRGYLLCRFNCHYGPQMPAMDSIAENGVLFEKAYCADHLCVPSRTVMMTGRMPHETGITYNVRGKRDSVRLPMMGTILSRAGYDCGYVGKWHIPNPVETTISRRFVNASKQRRE